jgi:hypothetical protein
MPKIFFEKFYKVRHQFLSLNMLGDKKFEVLYLDKKAFSYKVNRFRNEPNRPYSFVVSTVMLQLTYNYLEV